MWALPSYLSGDSRVPKQQDLKGKNLTPLASFNGVAFKEDQRRLRLDSDQNGQTLQPTASSTRQHERT